VNLPEPENAARATRVTVIDDDELFRESLCRNLKSQGFTVSDYPDGPSGLGFLLEKRDCDLVLLDWKMPKMNGLEVLQQIREAGVRVPVIFLTALTDQIYEESALLHGAVDFIDKSRSFTILLKRIELIESRGAESGGPDDSLLRQVGSLELDGASHRARWKERELNLTLNEFAIIERLATHGGRDLSYRELYDTIRGEGFAAGIGDHGYRANVRAFIKRIREKLREVDPDFSAIENFPGFGYRWRDDEHDRT
jgi:two-component system response regulator ChvI